MNDVIYKSNYQHWGVLQPGNILEPNNLQPSEFCAGSNLSMGISTYDKKGVMYDGVGGWADKRCLDKFVLICEIQREGNRNVMVTGCFAAYLWAVLGSASAAGQGAAWALARW